MFITPRQLCSTNYLKIISGMVMSLKNTHPSFICRIPSRHRLPTKLPSFVALCNVCLLTTRFVSYKSMFCHPFTQGPYVDYSMISSSLLPSVSHVSAKFSNPSFLIMIPRHFSCLFLMLCTRVLFGSIFFKTFSLVTSSLHGILSILL